MKDLVATIAVALIGAYLLLNIITGSITFFQAGYECRDQTRWAWLIPARPLACKVYRNPPDWVKWMNERI